MADNFYAQYPVAEAPGGEVLSLNGLVGALTLVAGTNITITPSGTNITIDGVASGANTFLSNLTSPTALNQDLIFDTGALVHLKTKDDTATTQDIGVFTGQSSTGNSGAITIQSGDQTGNPGSSSGAVTVQSGNAAGATSSLTLITGISTGASSGNAFLSTGTAAADSNTGLIQVITGDGTGTGASGGITVQTGNVINALSGAVSISTGNSTGGDGGGLHLTTGDGAVSNSGQLTLTTGAATATAVSGDIDLTTGTSVDGNSGGIALIIGSPSGMGVRGSIGFVDGSQGTAGHVWTSTDASGSGTWAAPSGGAIVRAKYKLAAAQTITASEAPIIFDTLVFDANSIYNSGNGHITVPTSGLWQIASTMSSLAATQVVTGGVVYFVYVNGAQQCVLDFCFTPVTTTNYYACVSGSTLLELAANDVITLVAASYGGDAITNGGANFTSFSIERLSS